MSLDPGNQFNEAGTSAADFNVQDQVLPNSPILSADVNAIAEKVYRRTTYLNEKWLVWDQQEDHDLTTAGATLHTITAGAGYSTIATIEITTPDCEVGDVLELNVSAIGDYVGGSGASVRFRVEEDFGGGGATINGVPFGFFYFPPGSVDRRETNVSLLHEITVAGAARIFWEGTADTTNLVLTTQILFSMKRWRPAP